MPFPLIFHRGVVTNCNSRDTFIHWAFTATSAILLPDPGVPEAAGCAATKRRCGKITGPWSVDKQRRNGRWKLCIKHFYSQCLDIYFENKFDLFTLHLCRLIEWLSYIRCWPPTQIYILGCHNYKCFSLKIGYKTSHNFVIRVKLVLYSFIWNYFPGRFTNMIELIIWF